MTACRERLAANAQRQAGRIPPRADGRQIAAMMPPSTRMFWPVM